MFFRPLCNFLYFQYFVAHSRSFLVTFLRVCVREVFFVGHLLTMSSAAKPEAFCVAFVSKVTRHDGDNCNIFAGVKCTIVIAMVPHLRALKSKFLPYNAKKL